VTLKPGLRSLKVIEDDTIRSSTHDFLLTFHINHRDDETTISAEYRQFFPPPVFYAPAYGFLLGSGYRRRGQKTRVMGLPDGQKSFRTGLVV